jgi:hypothetical protein
MKVYCTLLALSVFHPNVWGATAFLVQVPKALTSKGWQTTDATSPMVSEGDGVIANGRDQASFTVKHERHLS